MNCWNSGLNMGGFSQKLTEKLRKKNSNGIIKIVEKPKIVEEKSEISLCIKYILVTFNFLSCTIIPFGLAAYVIYNLKATDNEYPLERYWHQNKILLGIAALIFLVSLFGVIGSLREHLKCLSVYKYLVLFILLGQIIFLVILIIYIYIPASRYNIEFFPKESFRSDMQDYDNIHQSAMNRVDSLQKTFQCCGFSDNEDGYKDWRMIDQFKCQDSQSWNILACSAPISCCRLPEPNNISCVDSVLGKRPIDVQDNIYIQGCLKGFHTWAEINGLAIIGIVFSVIFPLIVLLVMAICLMNQITRQLAKWERFDNTDSC